MFSKIDTAFFVNLFFIKFGFKSFVTKLRHLFQIKKLKNVKKSKEKLTKNPCDIFRVKELSQGNLINIISLIKDRYSIYILDLQHTSDLQNLSSEHLLRYFYLYICNNLYTNNGDPLPNSKSYTYLLFQI